MAAWRCLAVAPLAVATPATAEFRPALGTPYHYDVTETRTIGGVARRFHVRRSVTFARAGTGYEAVVTLETVDQQAGGDVGAMFEAATGALRGHPLRYRLDDTGKAIDVIDSDSAIDLIASSIERMTAMQRPVAGRSGDSRALASPLRTLPAAGRLKFLLSIIAPLTGGSDRTPGIRAITLPGRPPLAPDDALMGTEAVVRDDRTLTIDTVASGAIGTRPTDGTPGATLVSPIPTGTEHVTIHRRIDRLTGLLIELREATETRIVADDAAYRTRIESVITFTPTTATNRR